MLSTKFDCIATWQAMTYMGLDTTAIKKRYIYTVALYDTHIMSEL